MVSLQQSSISQWPLHTRYCHLRSSASAICIDWHSTGSMCQDCHSTTKFRSQRTSHMEPSATSTTVTGPVGECFQAGTENVPVLDRPSPLRRRHDSSTGYKYPDLITYLTHWLNPSDVPRWHLLLLPRWSIFQRKCMCGHSKYQIKQFGPNRCKSDHIGDSHYHIWALCPQLHHCTCIRSRVRVGRERRSRSFLYNRNVVSVVFFCILQLLTVIFHVYVQCWNYGGRGREGPVPPLQLSAPLIGEKNRRQGAGLRPPNMPATQWNHSHKSRGGTTLKNLARHAPYSGIWGSQKLVPILRVCT